jgi:hypothetical protein
MKKIFKITLQFLKELLILLIIVFTLDFLTMLFFKNDELIKK